MIKGVSAPYKQNYNYKVVQYAEKSVAHTLTAFVSAPASMSSFTASVRPCKQPIINAVLPP